MAKQFLILGSLFGGLAVVFGAFGAHALKSILEANQRMDTYELASRYQFYHALALLAVGLLLYNFPHRGFIYAGYAFILGMLIFSGSLYVLSLTNVGWLGAITPLGGLALIVAWVCMIWSIGQIKL